MSNNRKAGDVSGLVMVSAGAMRRSPTTIAAVCVVVLMLVAGVMQPARAAIMANPQKLYAEMKAAYDKGAADGWTYRDQETYYGTILNAGRAYSLQHPGDPAYGELATLTVQIGAGLHYDPLTNHDGAVWWVREAAVYVQKHAVDVATMSDANALLARTNSLEHPERLATFADEDASANLRNYPRDTDALTRQVEANWRGWVITKDPKWRSLAFQRAAQPFFPVGHLPTTFAEDFITAARSAGAGVDGYTPADTANAKAFLLRLDALGTLRVIASETDVPHGVYMTTLAPADEYFGPLGMSVLGMRNEIHRLNEKLKLGWGERIAGDAVQVATSIDDLHKVYPRDFALPTLLASCYTLLKRFTSPNAHAAAARLRSILIVEYQDSPQARKLLGTG